MCHMTHIQIFYFPIPAIYAVQVKKYRNKQNKFNLTWLEDPI